MEKLSVINEKRELTSKKIFKHAGIVNVNRKKRCRILRTVRCQNIRFLEKRITHDLSYEFGEFKIKWVQKFISFKSQQKISYGNAKSHWNSEKCLRKVKESIMKQKKLLDTKKSVSEML